MKNDGRDTPFGKCEGGESAGGRACENKDGEARFRKSRMGGPRKSMDW